MGTVHITSNDHSFGCPIIYMDTIHITSNDRTIKSLKKLQWSKLGHRYTTDSDYSLSGVLFYLLSFENMFKNSDFL